MKRRLLWIFGGCALLLTVVLGAVMTIATTDAGARWVLARIDAAAAGNLNWAAAEGTLLGGMRLADLAYDDGASLIQIERLEFSWQPWRLLDGTLVLDRVDIIGLRNQTRVSGEPMTEAALRDLLASVPVAIQLNEFRAEQITLVGIDGATNTLDFVSARATLDDDGLMLRELSARRADLLVSGELRLALDLALEGNVAWQLPVDGKTYTGALTAGGTLREPELTHELMQPLRVTSRGTVVAGIFAGDSVSFALEHEFPLQLLAAVGQPDVQAQASLQTRGTPEQVMLAGTAHAELPQVAPVGLTFALTYQDGALNIDSATLTSAEIGLQGRGLLEFDPLAVRVDWNLTALNTTQRFPQLQLTGVTGTGTVQVAGAGEALQGALQIYALTGTLNGYPLGLNGMVTSAGDGTANVELQAATGANTLAVSGSVGEQLALAWEVEAPELDTLWQGLTGTLAGSGSVGGTRAAPEANGSLSGALRLERGADVLELAGLDLQAEYAAAGNEMKLTLGTVARTADGTRQVLLDGAVLTLAGTPEQHSVRAALTGPSDDAQLALQGSAANGEWHGTLQNVTVDSRAGDWRLEAPVAIDYAAGGWSLAQNCWSYSATRVCLQAAQAAGAGIDAQLALTGFPLAWLNPAASAPASKPAALQQLQDAFAANLPGGVLTEGELAAQATLRNFADGRWESLDLTLQPRGWVTQITQQVVDDADAAPLVQRFGLDVALAEVTARGDDWAGALDVDISHEQDGRHEVQGSLRGSGELAADGSLSGSASLAFDDLGWIEFLVPDVRAPAGMLNGTVGISGTRARPQLQASLELGNGRFDLPLYGLNIRDASLELATDARNVLRLAGTARSGDGLLQVSAELSNPLQQDRVLTAEVNGTNFLAFATDYATVTLSPQLSGSFAQDVLTVNGSIEVANTEVDLEEVFGAGGDNAVSVSGDVVIVSGTETSMAGADEPALDVAANVTVRIGENVHVSGYDLDANLSGELRVEQTPGRPVLVYGELGIPEGRYEIYNQELNARDGRLVFFGNPANPLLDVRAFRETESGEVGVHLTGNLDSIEGRLFSTPTLPDNEILSLLVTGKSFSDTSQEESDALVGAIANFGLGRGEGFTERVGSRLGLDTLTVGGGDTFEDSALGLGKYLTPELLMRYKLGLFDRQSVLGLEYTLSEHLKLEVETGISQSVDLNYTIEKD